MGDRRLTLANIQLQGRTWEDASFELQRFLEALNNTQDEGVIPTGNYVGIPATLEIGSVGLQGDPLDGWSAGRHEHPIPTGTPVSLGTANAQGPSLAFADLEHVHKRDLLGRLNDADVGVRGAFNFIDTATIAFTLADDAGNDELEITADVIPAGISHGDLADLGPPADDHPQYFHLPGRSGGQVAFGGTAASEVLTLRGADDPDLGVIEFQSPIEVDVDWTDTPLTQIINWTPTVPASGAAVTSFMYLSPTINVDNALFILAAVRDVSEIEWDVSPGFAVSTLFLAQPQYITRTAGIPPAQAFVLAAQAQMVNDGAGAGIVVANHLGVSYSPTMVCRQAGDTLTVTNHTGLNVAPIWSTVGGAPPSAVDFGTIRGVHMWNPAKGIFFPGAGTETMVAYYGLDMENITFAGNVPKAAVRSALAPATAARFLQNDGNAVSDFGTGHIYFDDNAGVAYGGTGAYTLDVWTSWFAAGYYRTYFAANASALRVSNPGTNRFLFDNDGGSATGEYNWNCHKFSLGAQTTAVGNNTGIFVAPAGRLATLAGEWSDFALTQGGNVDINGLAMSNVGGWKINAPNITLSGGTVSVGYGLLVSGNVDQGTTRAGLWVQSSLGTATRFAIWQSATGGITRLDGRLDINRGIALGAGAAATLGLIGGAGPTAAAQATWVEIDVGGVATWIAGWR